MSGKLRIFSEEKRSDVDFVREAVQEYGRDLEYASEELKNNPEIVMEAVKQNGLALRYASEELKNNPEIVLEAVKRDGMAFRFASKEIRSNPEIVKEAVKLKGLALKFASKEIRSNPEVVIEAVRQRGTALEYASEELKNNPEIVKEAVKHDRFGNALKFASNEIKSNPETIRDAIKEDVKELKNGSKKIDEEKLKTYRRKTFENMLEIKRWAEDHGRKPRSSGKDISEEEKKLGVELGNIMQQLVRPYEGYSETMKTVYSEKHPMNMEIINAAKELYEQYKSISTLKREKLVKVDSVKKAKEEAKQAEELYDETIDAISVQKKKMEKTGDIIE